MEFNKILTTKQIGDVYELYIQHYIKNNNPNIQCFLWSEVPEKDLRNSGLLGDWHEFRLTKKFNKLEKLENKKENDFSDFGVDLIVKNENNDYELIQCKNYSSNSITPECLAGFLLCVLISGKKGYVYYTSRLSKTIKDLKKSDRINYIHKSLDKDFYENYIVKIFDESEKIKKSESYSNLLDHPFDYQIKSYNNIMNKFLLGHKRCTLQMPCGLGKTLTSMMVSQHFNQIIIVSPLQQYCSQNLERYKKEYKFKDYSSLLIDSEGTRNIDLIKKFILNNEKFILSICFKSCDILYEILSELKNYIIIFDEFHHISMNDLFCVNSHKIGEILQSNSKIMFMSATPRLFDLNDFNEETSLNQIYFITYLANYLLDFFEYIHYKIKVRSIHNSYHSDMSKPSFDVDLYYYILNILFYIFHHPIHINFYHNLFYSYKNYYIDISLIDL